MAKGHGRAWTINKQKRDLDVSTLCVRKFQDKDYGKFEVEETKEEPVETNKAKNKLKP